MTANSTETLVDIIAIELRSIVQQDVTIPIKGPILIQIVQEVKNALKQELRQGLQQIVNQKICPNRQIFWQLLGAGLVPCFKAGSFILLSVIRRICSGASA
ncbi:MAG: hypothetical protein PUP93_00145 [Rhizonema sp. NSF051]|nr:hypothetical protein [Rhizonema sp. NSF051]